MPLDALLPILLAVALIAGAIAVIPLWPSIERSHKAARRLDLATPRRGAHDASAPSRVQPSLVSWAMRMQDVAAALLAFRESHLREARLNLLRAGHPRPEALSLLLTAKLILPLIGAVLGALLALLLGYTQGLHILLGALLLSFAGIRYPEMWLKRRIAERQEQAQNALSDVLDLLVISAEAGLGTDQALERVSREMAASRPVLAGELALTVSDLSLLPDRGTAWENLLQRLPLKPLRDMVTVLRQAERHGTVVGPSLRIVASELRKERMLIAKAKAARLPVLMTIPLALFLLPAMLLITVGPAALAMMDSIAGLDFSSMVRPR